MRNSRVPILFLLTVSEVTNLNFMIALDLQNSDNWVHFKSGSFRIHLIQTPEPFYIKDSWFLSSSSLCEISVPSSLSHPICNSISVNLWFMFLCVCESWTDILVFSHSNVFSLKYERRLIEKAPLCSAIVNYRTIWLG